RRPSPRCVARRFPSLPGRRTGSARRTARREPGSERTGTTPATRRKTVLDSPPPESRTRQRPGRRRRRQSSEGGSTGAPEGWAPARDAGQRDRVQSLGLQELHVSCAQGLQELPGDRGIEPGIPRFNRNEKGVVCNALEDLGSKQRVIEHRKPVQTEHAEDGAER